MSKVAIIGNGNVGSHLYQQISEKHEVVVYSRNPTDDKILSFDSFDASGFNFVILAVPDNAIEEVANQLEESSAIVMHVSGFKELSILNKHPKCGVFYPFQTFTKGKEVDFSKFPLFLEGNSDEVDLAMFQFARSVSNDVRLLTSRNRKQLHLAAVFVCNFTNHMYTIAEELMQALDIKFEDMSHLALETLQKAAEISPKSAQTGPALRKDSSTINEHLERIKDEDVKNIYKIITEHIQKTHA